MKFTLKFGIYYIVLEVMVNTEQIWFDQKGRVKPTSTSKRTPFYAQRRLFW